MSKHHWHFLQIEFAELCDILLPVGALNEVPQRRGHSACTLENTLTTSCPANMRMTPSAAAQHSLFQYIRLFISFCPLLSSPSFPPCSSAPVSLNTHYHNYRWSYIYSCSTSRGGSGLPHACASGNLRERGEDGEREMFSLVVVKPNKQRALDEQSVDVTNSCSLLALND